MGKPSPAKRGVQLIPFASNWGTFTWWWQGRMNTSTFIALLFGNLLLFAPLGFFLRPVFRSRKKAFWVGLGLFILLEALQAVNRRGVSDIDDVKLYIGGLFIGMAVFDGWLWIRGIRKERAL
ncbi:MAG: VanZ family protein [Turicibacter sp.]|nr:VanZ family protein [Turicibacter sp.]